jgi:superoxide dismutase, Cu-Zn family
MNQSLLKFLRERSLRLGHRIIWMILGILASVSISSTATAFSIESKWVEVSPNDQAIAGAIALSNSEGQIAQARLGSTSGSPSIRGQILLVETAAGLNLSGTLFNAPPGNHGFHIHEAGSCANAGMAAGGHFNPDQAKHGNLLHDGFQQAHAGDLGNLVVDSNGGVSLDQTFPGLTLEAGKYSVAGRAIVLHEKQDDFSQPTGNAGARIGCGVIVLSRQVQ